MGQEHSQAGLIWVRPLAGGGVLLDAPERRNGLMSSVPMLRWWGGSEHPPCSWEENKIKPRRLGLPCMGVVTCCSLPGLQPRYFP